VLSAFVESIALQPAALTMDEREQRTGTKCRIVLSFFVLGFNFLGADFFIFRLVFSQK
tara:strand:- start:271 stop:444 length:174 start_codon:yes stop_codon:yes gene_type:complete